MDLAPKSIEYFKGCSKNLNFVKLRKISHNCMIQIRFYFFLLSVAQPITGHRHEQRVGAGELPGNCRREKRGRFWELCLPWATIEPCTENDCVVCYFRFGL